MVLNRCRRGPRRWSISVAKVLGSQSIILGSSRHTASGSLGRSLHDLKWKKIVVSSGVGREGVGVEYGRKKLSKRKKQSNEGLNDIAENDLPVC